MKSVQGALDQVGDCPRCFWAERDHPAFLAQATDVAVTQGRR